MKKTEIAKISLDARKNKYFKNLMHAAFYASTNPLGNFEIENETALEDQEKYFSITPAKEEPDLTIDKLAANEIHSVYQIKIPYIFIQDERDYNGYHHKISTDKPFLNTVNNEPVTFSMQKLYIDNDRNLFWVDKEFDIEPTANALANLEESLNAAIQQTKKSNFNNYTQKIKLFNEMKVEFAFLENEVMKIEDEFRLKAYL